MGWTPEKLEQAKALWDQGLSAGQVARAVGGVSRNAVIGQAHRRGWCAHTGMSGGRHFTSTVREPVVRQPKLKVVQPTKEELDAGVTELYGPLGDFPAAGTCRFIPHDPKDQLQCCGYPTGPRDTHNNQEGDIGQSYCDYHDRICHQPRTTYNPDKPVGNPAWRNRGIQAQEAREATFQAMGIAAE